jgi:hypothetical protein
MSHPPAKTPSPRPRLGKSRLRDNLSRSKSELGHIRTIDEGSQ